MSAIFGHLNISDTDRVFSATAGQRVIYEAAAAYVESKNVELARMYSVFIARSTSDYKLRYKLPGGGYLQGRGPDGRYAATKGYGSWDVAFPLVDVGAMLSGNDVDMAYMTVAELERHILTIVAQNINTVRWAMLHRLWDDEGGSHEDFTDPLWGALDIQPLANGDAVTYPPVIGSSTEATEDHYLNAAYAVAAISDANDPIVPMVEDLDEHFGSPAGGSNNVVFINSDARTYVQALKAFAGVEKLGIRAGSDTAVASGWPVVPGEIIGRHSRGAWVSVWPMGVPASYMLGVNLDAEAPLIRRIDPADTGLGDGLQLATPQFAAADVDDFPFRGAIWRHRFGLGCGDRLNGVCTFLDAGGVYVIPAAFD